HSPSLFSPPPSPTNIYTLSLHDALPIYFVESSSYEINNRGTDCLEMFGIKKYSHEDNLNHIHWKLTSKFDELIVKELTETVNDTFLILIDLTIENEKSKNHPAVIDAMMDTFISTSEALLAE